MELDFDLYARMSQDLSVHSETYAERVLSQIAKATEEPGETASAFLIYAGFNPRKKGVTLLDVKSEVTDTIGTLLVLLSILSSDPDAEMRLMETKFHRRLAESQERISTDGK